MRKIPTEALPRQYASRCLVHSSSGHTGPNSPLSGFLGFQDGIVEAFYTPRGLAHENRACHIATVTAEYSTLVEDDQFVFPQQLSSGVCMRPSGPGACGHDG